MPCNGNPLEYCGGPNRLNMYTKLGGGQTSSTSATATLNATISSATNSIPTASVTAAAPSHGPVHVPKVGNYAYAGCWNESAAGPSGIRTLTGAVFYDTTNMTVEECAKSCAGSPWFGIEYYHECYCGQSPSVGSAMVDLGDCNFVCPGNSSEYCKTISFPGRKLLQWRIN